MKSKLNPLYILLTLIALFLAFGPLYLKNMRKTNFSLVKLSWLKVKLPGTITESFSNKKGVHFVSASDGKSIAVLIFLTSPANEEIAAAHASGAMEVAKKFSKLFPTQNMEKLNCQMDLPSNSYTIKGIRSEDKWAIRGRLQLKDKDHSALIILSCAKLSIDADYIEDVVFKSLVILNKNPSKYP